MDYGFAPDKGDTIDRLRNFFSHRNQTTLVETNGEIPPRKLETVQEFIDYLSVKVTPLPIGNALLGSHASAGGILQVPILRNAKSQPITKTDYETLDRAISNNALKISDNVIGNPPTGTHYFHIKGCNIGKASPFLQHFKAALGGGVTVTAPKHFYGVSNTVNFHGKSIGRIDIGIFEFMCYEFSVWAPNPIDDSDTLVAMFKSAANDPATKADFLYVNGTQVPDAKWDLWVPKKKSMKSIRQANLIIRDANKAMIAGVLKTPITASVGDIRSLLDVMQPRKSAQKDIDLSTWPFVLRVREEPWTPNVPFPTRNSIPSKVDDQHAAIKQSMMNTAKYKSSHAFPVYTRFGYKSFDDFYVGFAWGKPFITFKQDENVWLLSSKGTRITYTLVIPITDPTSANIDPFVDGVLTNFHPASSSFTAHTELPEPGTPDVPQDQIDRYFASA